MHLSLKYKFLLPALVIIIMGMGSISVFAHYTAKNALSRIIRDEIDNVAKTTVGAMSTWIQNRKLDIGNWSRQGVYQKALLSSFLGITAREFAVAQLKQIKEDYGYYKNIALADATGQIIASANSHFTDADPHLTGNIDVSQSRFFQEALKGEIYLSHHAVKDRLDGGLIFIISAPVLNQGQIAGVLFSVFDVATFAKTFIRPIGIGESGYAYIVTGDGRITSDPELSEIFGKPIDLFPFGRQILEKESGVIESELNHQPIFAAYKKLGKLNWTIAVCAFKNEVFSSVYWLKRVNFFVTAMVVVILGIVLFVITDSLSKPIREVMNGIKSMGRGHLDYRLKSQMPNDEVGEIGRALNNMAENLELSDLKIKDQNKLLAQARDDLELRVKQRTRDLEKAEEKYRSIFENAVEGIFQVSGQGVLLNANPSLADILGYSRVGEILGQDIFSLALVPEDTRQAMADCIDTHDEVIGYETRLFRTDNTPFWCSISARKFAGDGAGQTYYEGFMVDITQRREMETAQSERRAAEAANRAKSEFLANMSHEIRTPLNVLLGFSELIAKNMADPKQLAYTNAIKVAGKSLLTLINDILDLSKIEAGRMELSYGPVSIAFLFSEIQQIFNGKCAEKNLKFIVELGDIPPSLELDESRIRQIVLNLVGNATKFTRQGHIRLAAKTRPGKSHEHFDLVLSVTDTGLGIDQAHLDSIFESFRQVDGHLKKHHGGTGLGLTICKRLVQAMNGSICVTSKMGQGSRFEVCLKDVMISDKEASGKTSPGRAIAFKPALVLVVDDEEFNRYMLNELLTRLDLEVIEANDGEQAIAMAQKNQPDIIIMDIKMPVLDGNKATDILKGSPDTNQIPIIALTGDIVSLPGHSSAQTAYDGQLAKPVEVDSLLEQLSLFLETYDPGGAPEPFPRPVDVFDSLRLEEISNPESLIRLLETEFLPRCHAFEGSLVISRVTRYAEELLSTAQTHHLAPLVDFSRDLLDSSAVFDIIRIKQSLNHLPGLIRDIIHLLKKEKNRAKSPSE